MGNSTRLQPEPEEIDMDRNSVEGNGQLFENEVNEEIPPRRVVLRGALAVGCGLLLPASLFGCDSKKGETSTGVPSGSPQTSTNSAVPDSSPAPSAEPAAPAATSKVSPASVQYQSQPRGEQKCDGCRHFIAESNTCKLVGGQISSDGWCVLWVQKT